MPLRVAAATAAGAALALEPPGLAWAPGQALLALAFVQWFVLLHECGHGTLTGLRAVDRAAGRLAGVAAGIPFLAWRRVHALHHRWTGWQDLDPTTAGLAPRARGRLHLLLVDLLWWTGLPLVSLHDRLSNSWHLPGLARLLPGRGAPLALNLAGTATPWAALAWALGPVRLAWACGPALALAFLVEDQLILSQHEPVPQRVAAGARARPLAAREQVAHTRSLVVPGWVSRWLLLGVEAHERHHTHPLVPGVARFERRAAAFAARIPPERLAARGAEALQADLRAFVARCCDWTDAALADLATVVTSAALRAALERAFPDEPGLPGALRRRVRARLAAFGAGLTGDAAAAPAREGAGARG